MDCEPSRKIHLLAAWPLFGKVYISLFLPRLDGTTENNTQVEHSLFFFYFLLSRVHNVENYH